MSFKNALKLLISKFGLVWVLLLYMLAFLVVLVSLSLPFVLPLLREFHETGIYELISTLFNNIMSGAAADVWFDNVYAIVHSFTTLLQTSFSAAMNTALLLFLVFGVAYRFILGLYEIPLISALEGSMSSNAHIGFINCFISKMGKSCVFVLTKMLYTIVYDFCLYGIIISLFELFNVPYLKFFAPFIIMLVFLVFIALRYTLIANWSPAVVVGDKKIFPAFGYSVKKAFKNFGSIYSSFIIAWALIIAFNLFVGLFTFGAGLLATIPISMLFISLLNMTTYYGKNARRYYIDNTIVAPPEVKE